MGTIRRSVVLALILGLTSCGTLENMGVGVPNTISPKIYGGVAIDCYLLDHETQVFIAGIMFLFDAPLSLIADTLTLPITLFTHRAGDTSPPPPKRKEPESERAPALQDGR